MNTLYKTAMYGRELLLRGDDFDEAAAIYQLINEHKAMTEEIIALKQQIAELTK